jgi:MFS family permease
MIDFNLIQPLSAFVSEAWMEPDTAIKVGAFGGAILGSLCGIIGALAGILAPKGKAKKLVLGSMLIMALIGVGSLIFGIVAVSMGQPYGVWYPFFLIGAVLSFVSGPLIPVIKSRYRQADQRRLDAESLRRS